jgi:hypothetical protein
MDTNEVGKEILPVLATTSPDATLIKLSAPRKLIAMDRFWK